MSERVFTLGLPFCGLGLGGLGFLEAQVSLLGHAARFRCVGGLDIDEEGCADFEALTGAPALNADVASMTPAQLVALWGPTAPDVVFLSPPCLPGRGEVITASGPRPIETIRANDLVLSHTGAYRQVLKVGTHEYTGRIYGVRLNGTVDTQEFTAEHPIWRRRVVRRVGTERKRSLAAPEFVRADQLRAGDRVGFPVPREVPGCARAFVEALGDPQRVEKGGEHVGERYAKPAHIAVDPRIRDLRPAAESTALWYLVGAYLGDGYRRPDRHEVMYCVGATDSDLAMAVRHALGSLGLRWNEDRSGGITNVKLRVHAVHLCKLLGEFGDGAADKFIPEALMGLERKPLDALIRGYRETDGSESDRRVAPSGSELQARWRIVSISLPLLRGVQRLLLRRGEYGSIHVAWPGGEQVIEGRTVQTRPRWELSVRLDPQKRTVHEFDGDTIWIRVRDITVRETCERVWNLEVAEDNTFCAPLIATHNCKGFSGLLGKKKARQKKYRLLNRLVRQCVELILAAYPAPLAPPKLILIENVPGIETKGRVLLRRVRSVLRRRDYVFTGAAHNCGEIGKLAQSRNRYLFVARHAPQVPNLLYQPHRYKLRACGEVLGSLPLPNDPAAGPLHRLPNVALINWLRLALIPPGGDWRDLPGQEVHRAPARAAKKRGRSAKRDPQLSLLPTGDTSARAQRAPSSAAPAAGPLAPQAGNAGMHHHKYRVLRWQAAAGTVIGATRVGSGAPAAADPRVPFANILRLSSWEQPSPTVTSGGTPTGGGLSVGDPRLGFSDVYGVLAWDDPAGTVTGRAGVTTGRFAVADVRVHGQPYPHTYGVLAWSAPAHTITGQTQSPGTGPFSVADPRMLVALGPPAGATWFKGKYGVLDWDAPSRTVIGGPSNGADAVADVRLGKSPWENSGAYGVLGWGAPAWTVTGSAQIDNGRFAVADARLAPVDAGPAPWVAVRASAARTARHATTPRRARSTRKVSAAERPLELGFRLVFDPRVPGNPKLLLTWHPWDLRSKPPFALVLPTADGTWHRPLTLLELMALQDMPLAWPDGTPIDLAGVSMSRKRERVGNAVPRAAARAMGEQFLTTLLGAELEFWAMGGGDVWVRSPDGAPVELGTVQ